MEQEDSFQNGFIQKERYDADVYDSLFVLPHLFAASCHDDFLESVTAVAEWKQFLAFLFRSGDGKGRLDVGPAETSVDNEVDFVSSHLAPVATGERIVV